MRRRRGAHHHIPTIPPGPYRELKKSNLTRWSGQFIAEGWLVVERLLASDCEIESVLVSERRRETIVPRIPPDVPVIVVPQETAQWLLGYNFHAGVLACAQRKPGMSLDGLMNRAGGATKELTLVACDRIVGPENLGTIIRLCAAFGVTGLLLGPGGADPFSRRVLRVSMGNALAVPIVASHDLAADLAARRERWNCEWSRRSSARCRTARETCAVLAPFTLGNEAEARSGPVRRLSAASDHPVVARADSLNVACAAAIFLHHFARRTGVSSSRIRQKFGRHPPHRILGDFGYVTGVTGDGRSRRPLSMCRSTCKRTPKW